MKIYFATEPTSGIQSEDKDLWILQATQQVICVLIGHLYAAMKTSSGTATVGLQIGSGS